MPLTRTCLTRGFDESILIMVDTYTVQEWRIGPCVLP
jgi:hypothetical protein